MSKITFILGGARSGKSSYAVKLAENHKKKKVAFIATCEPRDDEMKERVNMHRKSRPAAWDTFVRTEDIAGLLENFRSKYDVIIIDCLTLLVSNYMVARRRMEYIAHEIDVLLKALKKTKSKTVIVSNEAGLGIVPENKMARDFRDIAGRVNQMVAKNSNRVFFMVSGIPWRLK